MRKTYVDIEDIIQTDEPVQMVDIQVDTPDSTFMLANGILTHNSNIGIINQLAIGAKITSTRGSFVDQTNENNLNSGVLGVNSSMVPYIGSTDGCRVMFSGSQGRQTIPINGAQPPIVQTGYESVMTSMLSESYVKKADDDGIIQKISDISIIIKKKNGRLQVVDLTPQTLQSGQGNDSLNSFKPTVTIGQKVKQGQIVAEGKHIIDGMISTGTNLLCAIMTWKGYSYEDGYIISDRVAKQKFTSSAYHEVEVLVKKDDDVKFIAKLGDDTKRGQPLLVRTSREVESIVGLDDDELLQGQILTKSPGGKIVKVEIYPNSRITAFPTLQPEFEKFKAIYEETKGPFPKKFKAKIGTNSDKEEYTGVLIRFHLEEQQVCELGDKITNSFGGKGVIAKIEPLENMPQCYDDQTEIFTNRGWILFKDLTDNDEVAYIKDLSTFSSSFIKPISRYSNHYSGVMFGAQGGRIDYLVTPNHRMYCRQTNESFSDYSIRLAEEIHNKKVVHRVNSDFENSINADLLFNLENITCKSGKTCKTAFNRDDFCEFLGYYISEGHTEHWASKKIYKHGRSFSYGICISQSKRVNPDICDKIEKLLTRMGLRWKYRGDGVYSFSNKSIYTYVKKLGLCYDKYIPQEIFTSCNKEQLSKMFFALIDGDGSYIKNGYVYYTTSEKLSHDISRLASLLGYYVAAPCIQTKNRNHIKYCIYIWNIKNKEVLCSKPRYYTKDYCGNIYCVEVPNGLVFVRRNKKQMWCGNTPWGEPVDVILNPIAVINRMNPSTIKELQTSLIMKFLARKVVAAGKKKTPAVISFISKVYQALDNTKDRKVSTPIINAIRAMSAKQYEQFVTSIESNDYFLPIVVPPFQEPTLDMIRNAMKIVGCKAAYHLKLREFNQQTEKPIAVGYIYYKKLEQQSNIKMSARSTGMVNPITRQAMAGKKVGGGQKIGEMDSWSLIDHGAINVLREFFGPLSDDHVTKDQLISEIVLTGSSDYKKPKSSPTRELFLVYMKGLMLEPDL